MKGFLARHKVDLIIFGVVIALALAAFIPFIIVKNQKSDSFFASIYRQSELLLRLDLSQEGEERSFEIMGTKSEMEISVKHNAIKVSHSHCPSQYCVHMGYVSTPGLPIVCAYNGISIVLEGGDSYSVIVG